MENAADKNEERESPIRTLGRFLGWAAVIFMIYLGSIGPVVRFAFNRLPVMGNIGGLIELTYRPVEWMYRDTPLHRPIGMYLHLWNPSRFTADGEPAIGK